MRLNVHLCFVGLSSFYLTRRGSHRQRVGFLCAALAMVVLVGCGGAPSEQPVYTGPPRYYAAAFTESTTYDAVLQTVTDLGLQPGYVCAGEGSAWQPMGQRASFAAQHLLAFITYDAPQNWMDRLQAAPGVVNILYARQVYPDQPTPPATPTATAAPSLPGYATPTLPSAYDYSCPLAGQGSTAIPLNASQAGAYARVVFTSPLATYGDALAVVVNLGLRLADPCRDQATSRGTPPAWQSPGQASAFASTHALVIATMRDLTSSQWQIQLTQVPGVSGVQTPYAPTCG